MILSRLCLVKGRTNSLYPLSAPAPLPAAGRTQMFRLHPISECLGCIKNPAPLFLSCVNMLNKTVKMQRRRPALEIPLICLENIHPAESWQSMEDPYTHTHTHIQHPVQSPAHTRPAESLMLVVLRCPIIVAKIHYEYKLKTLGPLFFSWKL